MNAGEFWKIIEEKIKKNEQIHIIFLCAGNICRSPYAEMRFKQLLNKSTFTKKNLFKIQSGGFIKQREVQIHPFTARLLEEQNVNKNEILSFKSRTMRKHKEDLISADALIVMTKSNRDILVPMRYRDKTLLISSVALNGKEIDIADPALLKEYNEYKLVMSEIDEYIHLLIKKLEKLEGN